MIMMIEMTRVWAMPNKWTFTIKPIKELLRKEMGPGSWIDPFAGMHSPAQLRNDLNPESNAQYHMDALDFIKIQEDESFDGLLFDPPYSVRQVAECYKGIGIKVTQETTRMTFYSNIKNEISRIIKPGGKVISCGWNSMGMGKNRGFKIKRILLVPHGAHKNDTIVTVEIKPKQMKLDLLGSCREVYETSPKLGEFF